jgi:hypothetical protein
MFLSLSKKAKIHIWGINGKRITNISIS